MGKYQCNNKVNFIMIDTDACNGFDKLFSNKRMWEEELNRGIEKCNNLFLGDGTHSIEFKSVTFQCN